MKKLSFVGSACFFSMLACVQFVIPLPLLAQVSSPVTPPVHTQTVSHPGQLNLNLSSTQHSTSANHLLHNGAVNINVGGSSMTVTPATLLTAAERLAVAEVLRGGTQTLQLGALGNAVGGSFTLSAGIAQHISSLVIPQGVTAILNTGKTGTINLSGNLTDAGSLYAVSRNPSLTNITLDASNIIVSAGALLTTVIPAAGLPGVSSVLSNLSLTLNALNNISNAGTISSAGNLSLNAGGSITNGGAAAGSGGTLPALTSQTAFMTAANNVTLSSATGTFLNTGLIAAQQGNVNFSTGQTVANIVVNGAGGTIQATNGAINFRDPGFTGNFNLTLNGGDYLSRQLNAYSGTGAININVGQLTGQLNSQADEEHVNAQTSNLNLGNTTVNGDPTFYNDTGNISITGDVTATENLAIVAFGNITATAGSAEITTNGNSVSLIAGASITPCGTCSLSTSLPPGTPVPSGQTISISAPTGEDTGGNINLSSSTQSTVINSSTTGLTGGNVSLVAFSGATAGTGSITLGSGQINASGGSTGGNVSIIAGATSGTSYQSGSIITNGGTVSIYAATPSVPGGTITADSHGNLSAAIAAGTAQAASILVNGNINTSSTTGAGGSITLSTGSATTLTTGSGATNGVTGTLNLAGSSNGNYGNLTLTASAAAVSVNESLTAANISITGTNLTAGDNTLTANGTAVSGANGVVTLSGNGVDTQMNVGGTSTPAGQFNVTSNSQLSGYILSSIKGGTLILQDPSKFNLSQGLVIDVSGESGSSGNYNLEFIGTSNSTTFVGNEATIRNGSNNITIIADGGIATGDGDAFSIENPLSSGNGGSLVLVSAGNIGNSTGLFEFELGAAGNGGNVVVVAGANNVTTLDNSNAIQIGANIGGASGGNISLPSNSLYTFNTAANNGNAGNVTLAAFAGSSSGSGQVSAPGNSNQLGTFGVYTSCSSCLNGAVTIVAGATSMSTSGSGTGYTISTGGIGAGEGTVGNVTIVTAAPNVSTNPVVISTNSFNSSGAGVIVSGSFLGGTPADGAINVGAIGASGGPSTANTNIVLMAGSNAVSSNYAISVVPTTYSGGAAPGSIIIPSSSSGDVVMMSGIAGTSKLGTNSYNINVSGSIQAGNNSNVLVSSVDSIAIQGNLSGLSVNTNGGSLTMVAGTSLGSTTPGNISIAGGISTNSSSASGNVSLVSMGSTGTIGITGGINTSNTTAGGSIAVSSASGTITVSGSIDTSANASSGATTGGDVLLTTGYSGASQAITVATGSGGISTSASSSSGNAGQIWVITNSAATGTPSNVSTSNTTQNQGSNRQADPVLEALATSSISSGNTTTVVFTPSSVLSGSPQTGSVTGFSPGGFTSISDTSSAAGLEVSVGGTVVTDNQLIVPIVSTGTFSLGNTSGSTVEVPASKGIPTLAFFGSQGITIGSSGTNTVSITTNSQGAFLASLGSNAGSVIVDNGASLQAVTLGPSITNGSFGLTNTGAINVNSTQVSSSVYSLTTSATLIAFNANVLAPQDISAVASASNAAITENAGSLVTFDLVLTSGTGGLGISISPITTTAAVVLLATTGSAFVSDSQSAIVSTSGSIGGNLTFTDTLYTGLLVAGNGVNPLNGLGTITLQAESGSNGGIDIEGNVGGGATSITLTADGTGNITNGAIQSGGLLTSPTINLNTVNGNIGAGTGSSAIAVQSGGGGTVSLTAKVSGTSGSVYVQDTTASDSVSIANTNSSGSSGLFNLSVSGTGGNITEGTSGLISSPTVVLNATNGNIGTGTGSSAIAVQSGGSGTVSFTATAGGTNGSVFVQDTTANDSVSIVSINSAASGGQFNLSVTGTGSSNITEGTSGLISSPTVVLNATNGSIGTGTGSSAIAVQSGGGGTVSLTATAGGTNGSVFVQDTTASDSVSIVNTNSAAAGGQFNLSVTAGGSIFEGTSGLISSPTVVLNATNGSIGTGTESSAIAVQSGGGGTVSLTATAGGTSTSVYVQDTAASDSVSIVNTNSSGSSGQFNLSVTGTGSSNITEGSSGLISSSRVVLNATNGSIGTETGSGAIAVQSGGSGALGLTATAGGTNGSVFVQDMTASDSVSIVYTNSATAGGQFNLSVTGGGGITEGPSGLISSPTVVLNASNGSIGTGTGSSAIAVQSGGGGTVSLTATAGGTNGSVFVQDSTAGDSVSIVNTNSAESGGQFNLSVTGTGSNITEGTSGLISSPTVALNATNGSIGTGTGSSSIAVQSGGGGTVSLTATAGVANGSVFIQDTTNNESVSIVNTNSSGSSGQFNLSVTGTGGNITEGTSGLISSPTVVLNAINGSIGTGTESSAIAVQSGGGGTVSLTATAGGTNGSVFVQDTTAGDSVSIANTNSAASGGQFNLSVTGTGSNITEGTSGLISSPTVVLNASNGSIGTSGAIAVQSGGGGTVSLTATAGASGGTVYIQDTTASDSVSIVGTNGDLTGAQFNLSVTGGGGITEGPSGLISSPTVVLNASQGSIGTGTGSNAIAISGGGVGVSLIATADGTDGSVFIQDTTNNESVSIVSTNSAASGGQFNLSVTGASGNITEGASGLISSPTVVLNSANGSIGTGMGPAIAVASQTGTVSLTATAGGINGSVFVQDTFSNNSVSIVGTNSAASGGQFHLSVEGTGGNITEGASGWISSPTVVLYATNGSIGTGTGASAIAIQSGGGGTVSLTATAGGTSGSVFVLDTTASDSVSIVNTNSAASGGQFNLGVTGMAGNITEGSSGLISSPTVVLNATNGSIGTGTGSSTISVQSGGGGTVSLTATASGINGSVFVQDTTASDSVSIVNTNSAASGGQFNLSVTGTGSSKIMEGTSGLISSPTLVLNATNGSIGTGTGSSAIAVQSGGSGTVSLTATAGGTNGSVFIQDTTASDSVSIVNTNSSGSSGQFNLSVTGAGGNITEGTSGLISSPTVVLNATNGSIGTGTGSSAIAVQSGGGGTVSLTATTGGTNGSVFVQDTTAGDSVSIVNTNSAASGGQFSLSVTGTGSSNITQGTSGLISSPTLVLNATNGSIGTGTGSSAIAVQSGGCGTVSLTATAGGTNGSVYVQDTTASDSVSIVNTNSSGSSGQFNLSVTGTGSSNITEGSSGLISSPTIFLNSTNGSIGSTSSSVMTSSSTLNVSAPNATNGNVYVASTNNSVALQTNSGIGNTLQLTVPGPVDIGILSNFFVGNPTAVPNLALFTQAGSGTNITISVSAQTTGSLTLHADGSIVENGGYLEAPYINLSATTGNIGASGGPGYAVYIYPGAGGIFARTPAGSIYLYDDSSDNVVLANTSNTPITAGVAFNLTSGGSISALTPGSTAISSPTILLTAAGNIAADSGATTALLLSSGTSGSLALTAAAGGNVLVSANGSITLQGANTAGGSDSFSVSATSGSNGSIDIQGNVSAAGGGTIGTIILSADGSGSITESTGTGTLTATTVELSAGSTGGIGSISDSIQTSSTTLELNAPNGTSGSAYVASTNNTVLFTNTDVGNTLQLTVPGNAGVSVLTGLTVPNLALITTTGGINVDTSLTTTSSITLTAQTNIVEAGGSLTSNTISLTATSGNIGASGSGSSVVFDASTLNLSATNASNGNVYVQSPNATFTFGTVSVNNLLQLTIASGGVNTSILSPVSGSIPNLALLTAAGDITSNAAISATNSITLTSSGSVFQATNGLLSSPIINLTAQAGSIGVGTTSGALTVSGGAGQATVTASATAASDGEGNVYLTDADHDTGIGSNPALLLGSSSANGETGDSTGGNFVVTTTQGSIGIQGLVTATTSITAMAAGSIVNTAGSSSGEFSSPTISLTASNGNVGGNFMATPIYVSSGTAGVPLNLTVNATAVSTTGLGNVNIADNDSDPVGGQAFILGTSSANGLPGDQNGGQFCLCATGGSINIAGTVSATTELDLGAHLNIVQGSGGLLSSPKMQLSSDIGNIGGPGSQAIQVTGGGVQLTLDLVSTHGNEPGTGNIYITDADSDVSGQPALLLNTVTAGGSLTPADPTNGILVITASNGSIGILNAVNSISSLTLSAYNNIVQVSGGSLLSPSVNLAATTGSIGASGSNNAIAFGNDGHGVSFYASAGGSVYATDSSSELVTLMNTLSTPLSAGGSFTLAAQSIAASVAAGTAIASPSISLLGVNNITADGTSTGGALLVSSGGSPSGLSLFAQVTSAGTGIGYVNLKDPGSETVTLVNNLNSNSPLSATASFALSVNGSIGAANGNVTAILSPNVSLVATGGDIGTSSNPLLVNNAGGGVSLFASANGTGTGQGSLWIADNYNSGSGELLTLNNSSGTPNASVLYSVANSDGSIVASSLDQTAVTAQSVSLVATNGDIGSSANPLLLNNAGSGLSLYAQATGTSSGQGSVWITDNSSTSEVLTLNNTSSASLNGAVSFSVSNNNGAIAVATTGSTAITSPSVSLAATGNIGTSSGGAVIIASGTTSPVELTASSTGGSVWMQSAGSVTLEGANGASPGGMFSVTTTPDANGNGAILIDYGATVTVNTVSGTGGQIILQSSSGAGTSGDGSIIQNDVSNVTTLMAATIQLNASTNVFGTGSSAVTASTGVGATGASTVTLSANSAGSVLVTNNSGNVVLTGSNGAGNAQTYEVDNLATNGSIDIQGNVAANVGSTIGEITLTASGNGNITESTGTGVLTATTVALNAGLTGGIGSSTHSVQFDAGVIDLYAPDMTNGKVYIQSTTNSFSFGTVDIGYLLQLTVPNSVDISILSSFFAGQPESIPNLALITQAGGGGDITVDTNATTTGSLTLQTDGSISDPSSGGGPYTLISPVVNLIATTGSIGAINAVQFSNNGGGVVLFASANAVSGQVNLFDPSSDAVTLANTSSTPLSAGNSFSLETGGSIFAATPASTAIASPSITLVSNDNITATGLSGGGSLLVNSGSTSGLLLFAEASNSGTGIGYVNMSDNNAESVTLANDTNPNAPLLATASFVFSANGSIVAADPAITAIQSPSVSLVATNGDVGASGTSRVLVNNAGGGLSLFASISGTSSGQGSLWMTDNSSTTETLTLNNNTSALSAAVLFSFTNSNGSIVAATPASTAITAPTVSLTATNGDIGTAGNSRVLMNNGGNGLSLFASATGTSSGQGSLWVTDNWTTTSEILTLNNTASSALSAGVLFSATNSNGSIVAATPGSTAVMAPSVLLTATEGDIGTSSTSQVLVNNGGSGVSLFASATGTSGGQGSLWISDNCTTGAGETLTLNNASSALSAGILFSVTNQGGGIESATPGSTAVTAPSVSLVADNGLIGTSTTSQILVNNGGGGLYLYAAATGTGLNQGSLWISDNYTTGSGETLTLNNTATTPLGAALSFSVTNENGSIVAATPGSTAVLGPKTSLTATNGDIGTSSGSQVLVNNAGGGVLLAATASGSSNGQGSLWITDNSSVSELVTLHNSTNSALTASVLFSVTNDNGGIVAHATTNTAVMAPNVSLIAESGNIGTSSTTPLLVNNNGNGLTLFASATGTSSNGSLWISDNYISGSGETLTLNNATTALSAGTSFNVTNQAGSIVAATPASTAITAPGVWLTATNGDIGTSGTSQVLVNNGGNGLSLFASAAGTSAGQGSVWITDNSSSPEALTLSNTSTTPNAPVSFNLTNSAGSVLAATTGSTAVAAPSIALTATNGNIATSSNPLIVSSGNSGTQLSLSVNATATSTGNGNVYITNSQSDVGSAPALLLGTSTVTGLTSDTSTGNLVVTTTVGSIGVSGTVSAFTSLTLNAGNNIVQSGGLLAGPTMALTATTGNIGSSGTALAVSSGNSGVTQLNLTASATADTANNGNVYVTDGDANLGSGTTQQALVINSLAAGSGSSMPASGSGNIGVTTTLGGMTVSGMNGISATNSITLHASATSGGSSINFNSNVNSSTGTILIENDDATVTDNATINFGTGVTVASGQAAVTVTMGAFTGPVMGTAPQDVAVVGNVAFGNNSITGPGAGNNATVAGTAAQLAFQTNAASQIMLANGSVVRAGPAGSNITSLDLTLEATTSAIIADQANPNSGVTGTLIVNSQGVATGGNVIFSTNASLFNVMGEDIPSGVTVDFKGFQTGNLINISTTSHAPTALISGTEAFIAATTPSNGVMNITQTQAGTPTPTALSVASTGLLTTDNSMTINVGGIISNAGQITSTGGGNITLNATGSNGNIAVGNNITTSGSGVVSITASQALTRTAGTITGGTVNLGGNSIGTTSANIMTVANILSTATTGSAFVTNTGISPLSLAASTAGSFTLTSASNITVTGNLDSATVLLQGSGTNVAIAIGAQVGNSAGTVQLLAKGTGAITETGSGGLVQGTMVTLSSGSGSIGTAQSTANAIVVTANTLIANTTSFLGAFISSTGPITVNSSSSGGAFNLSSTGSITVGQAVTAGTVILSTTTLPGAPVVLNATVTANGGVTINTSGGNVTQLSTAAITTPLLTISTSGASSSGTVGTSSGPQLTTNASAITVTTSGTNENNAGNVYLKDTSTTTATLNIFAQGGSDSGSIAGGLGGTVAVTVTGPVSGSVNSSGGASGTAAGGYAGSITIGSTSSFTVASSGLTLTASGGAGATQGTANNATLSATGSAGAVSLLGNLAFTSSGSGPGPGLLTVQATGTGTITQSGGVTINSPTLTLSASSGNIGTTTQSIVLVSATGAASLVASTSASVYLQGGTTGTGAVPTTVTVNGSGASGSGSIFQLTDVSPDSGSAAITVEGGLTATTISLQANNTSGASIAIDSNMGGASTTSVTIAAGASGKIEMPGGVGTPPSISTATLMLSSGSGCIGCSGIGSGPINTNASTLSVNTTGSVNISESNTGSTTTLMPSTGSSFTLTDTATSNSLAVIGALTAPVVSLTTVNGNIQVNAAVSASTSASFTTSAGSITSAGTLVYSPSVTVSTTTGNVGTQSAPFGISSSQSAPATNLSIVNNPSGGGSVFIGSNSPVTFGSSFTETGTFALTANGSISLGSNTITASTVTLTANGTGSAISQTTAGGATSITAGTIVLTANSGGIGSSSFPLGISTTSGGTTQLTVSTTGSAVINANSNVNFVGASSAAGSNGFTLTTNGNSVTQSSGAAITTPSLTIDTTTSAAANAGNVGVSGTPLVTNASLVSVITSGGFFTPNAFSAGVIYLADTNTSGAQGQLTATGGNVGGSTNSNGGNGANITLTVSAPVSGLSINASGGSTNGASSTGGNAGTVQVSGSSSLAVGEAGLTLNTSGGLGNTAGAAASASLTTSGTVSLLGNVTFTASGTGANNALTIQSTGAGNITQTSGMSITTGGGNLALKSVNGVIGTVLAPITLDAGTLSVNTAGAVNLSDTLTAGVTLGASTGSVFNLTTAGNLTVNENVTSNGNMNLIQTGGTALTIDANLLANGGSMVIQNQDATGSIVLGNGSSAFTIATNVTSATKGTSGQIMIYLGTATPPQSSGHTGSNVNNINISQTTSGTAWFGTTPTQIQGGTTGSGATAQVNLKNQSVFFNVPNATGTITINEGVTVQADPQNGPVLVAPQINSFTGSGSGSSGSVQNGADLSSGVIGSALGLTAGVTAAVNGVNGSQSASSNNNSVSSSVQNSTNFNAAQAGTSVVGAHRDAPTELSLAPAIDDQPSAEDDVIIYTGMSDRLSQPAHTGRIAPRYENEVSEYTPISYLAPTAPELNPAPINALESQPHHPTMNGGTVNLNRGSVLFAPEKDLLVKTPTCTIAVAARCVVLVSVTGSTVAAYDMYDVHSGDVVITTCTETMTLLPGKHVALTNADGSFASINAMHRVGYRNLKLRNSSDGLKHFTGDFSISSAITAAPRIREMLRSANPNQVAIAKRMIKTAAIIAQTKRLSAPYSRISDR